MFLFLKEKSKSLIFLLTQKITFLSVYYISINQAVSYVGHDVTHNCKAIIKDEFELSGLRKK